jgi:probable rRNA maturation factor
MITTEISERYRSKIDAQLIEQAALITLQQQSVGENAELTIVISDDEHLHSLNLQFRDIDAPTDVLSFPADIINPEFEAPYLGDVIISYPRAEKQAKVGGHMVNAEVQLLVVHGILHLLGHDHVLPAEKAEMWTNQIEILQLLGLSHLVNSEIG